MSTQDAVTGGQHRAAAVRAAMLLWLAACAAFLFAASVAAVEIALAAPLSAVLAAPAAATWALAGRLCAPPVRWALIGGWVLAATAFAALSGGALGPGAVVFALAPAVMARAAPGWPTVGAAALALAGAVAAEALAQAAALGAAPAVMTLGAVCALAALAARAPAPSRPRTPAPDRVAIAAHELRTPLTHVIGFADMMKAQVFGPLAPRYLDYAGLIRDSGASMLETLNAILDLSRLHEGDYALHKERFDIAAEARHAAAEAEGGAAPRDIAVRCDAPDGPVDALADRIAVRRILANLIGNAIKFTPAGGRVTVRVRRLAQGAAIEVEDSGPGIPLAARARVREAFAQTDLGRAAGGSGLGLALVQALAEAHGGALDIGDAPGGGALVRVRLPVG